MMIVVSSSNLCDSGIVAASSQGKHQNITKASFTNQSRQNRKNIEDAKIRVEKCLNVKQIKNAVP